MSALEVMHSLDNILADAKAKHEDETKQLKDQLLAAQMEATIHKELHKQAVEARASAERFAQNLLTRFNMVEDVFFDLKQIALQAAQTPPTGDSQEKLPNLTPSKTEVPNAGL